MYYAFQYLNQLNEEFKDKLIYKEYKFEHLEKYIMCIWTMQSNSKLEKEIINKILPDLCIDLVINLVDKSIQFVGFSRATENYILTNNISYIGIRFKPGMFHNIFNYDADKIMDKMVLFSDIDKNRNLNEIFNLPKLDNKISYLVNYLEEITVNLNSIKDTIIIDELYEKLEYKYINNVSNKLGYSNRQMNRIFKKYYGVNIKIVLNILRLHKSIELLLNDDIEKLTELAYKLGYHDQAHFINDIKRYCGISPTKLLNNMSQIYNL